VKEIKSRLYIFFFLLCSYISLNVFGNNNINSDFTFSDEISGNEYTLDYFNSLNNLLTNAVEIEFPTIITVYFSNAPIEYFFKNHLATPKSFELLIQRSILRDLYIAENVQLEFSKSDIIYPFHNFL
jgi:hypothetical protein